LPPGYEFYYWNHPIKSSPIDTLLGGIAIPGLNIHALVHS